MENKKKIKIVIGDIIKLLNININISFKQFLDVVRGTLFLNKEDNFHLKYGKTELNEMNYKEIISSSKIKLDLIMEGRSFILKSIYSKNNFLKEDLDGISQTIYDYDKLNNFTMPNEFFERINKLETTIIQKIESNQNSMNKKFNDIKNGNKTIINYLKNNLEEKRNNNLSNYSNNYIKNKNVTNCNDNNFKNKNYKNEICSECQTFLSNIKYECIFCPNPIVFCNNCAKKHIQHPLLEFNLNIDYKELNNGYLIISYLKNKYSTIPNNNDNFPINSNQNQISYFDKDLYYNNEIKLSLLNINPNKIALPLNEESLINIQIFNDSVYNINKLKLITHGGKRVKIQDCDEISINRLEKKNFSLGVRIDDGPDNEEEKITFKINNEKRSDIISVKPLEVTFFIISDIEKAKYKNLDIYLQDKNIVNIDEEDKIKLLSLMKENNEPFDEKEVNKILKK